MPKKRAVFLDRDGTLIKTIHRPDFNIKFTAPFAFRELSYAPGVLKVLNFLRGDFLRIMVTNQPDVANGYMSESEWNRIHQAVLARLPLEDFYMCRHTRADNCPFTKPSPMMLLAAADKWGIDLSNSFMVGDMHSDMEAGRNAGCTTVLIRTAYNQDAMGNYDISSLENLIALFKAIA